MRFLITGSYKFQDCPPHLMFHTTYFITTNSKLYSFCCFDMFQAYEDLMKAFLERNKVCYNLIQVIFQFLSFVGIDGNYQGGARTRITLASSFYAQGQSCGCPRLDSPLETIWHQLYQNYVILRNALDFFWKLCSRGEAPAGVGYKKAKKLDRGPKSRERQSATGGGTQQNELPREL